VVSINGYRWMSGVDQWVPVGEWCGSMGTGGLVVSINGCRWMSGVDQWVPLDEWCGSMGTSG
jgi:hypothetical protein